MSHPSNTTSVRSASVKSGRAYVVASLFYKVLFIGLVTMMMAAFFVACGQDGDSPWENDSTSTAGGEGGTASGLAGSAGAAGTAGSGGAGVVCVDTLTRECVVTLEQNGDVLSCYHGTQTCQGGQWGTCRDGTMSLQQAPPKSSAPKEKPSGSQQDLLKVCTNNPCDPTCQVFDEDPDGGLKSSGQTPVFTWNTGDLGQYPGGIVDQGIKQPCTTGYDCQFNQYCSSPAIGSAEHNICAVGAPISRNTNACVDLICPIDQTCCTTTYAGTCEHDYCDTGAELANGCDTCVNAICAADPDCCGGTCAHSYCDTGSSLSKGCNSCVDTICNADPKCCNLPTPQGTCPHDYCATGSALIQGCESSCVNSICAAEPDCCNPPMGTCSHDLCATGTTLATGCDSCVTAICAEDPKCCNLPGGACSHDFCATGEALVKGCNSCVDSICNAESDCCNPPQGTCAHNPCTTGTPLANGCDSCVSTICADDPKCCNLPGGACSHDFCATGEALIKGCNSCVDSICNAEPDCCNPPEGTCSHNPCTLGAALTNGCDSCVNTICADDPKCCNLPTIGACSHDYCATGAALTTGCDSCVTSICAAFPNCCGGNPPAGSCAHNQCVTGVKLASNCNACVAAVCASPEGIAAKCCTNPGNAWTQACIDLVGTKCTTAATQDFRCDKTWTAACVGKVATTCGDTCTAGWGATCKAKVATKCGKTCSTGNWDASCVAKVGTTCGDTCTVGWGTTCKAKVASMCGKTCSTGNWDASCVAKVGTTCGDTCTASWGTTCTAKVASVCGKTCSTGGWDASCVAKVGTTCGDTCTAGWGTTCTDKVTSMCGKSCEWDQSCKDKVGTICGKSCGPFDWDQSCVDKVGSVCGDVCYPDPPCSHNKCDSGGPLTASCDPCVATICAQIPDCCNKEWSNLCVDRVKTLCGEGCNVKGDCVPWLPAQRDPNCAGFDLTVGVPCGATIPVCNHGNATVPAGVRLVHFPAGSLQFPKCAPDQSLPGMQSCTTSLPIAPGKCINVPAASCGLGATNREIMVNPPSWNGNLQLPECRCQDNWSLWAGPNISCQPPTCSNTTTATLKRVNMFIQFDKSGSMGTSLGNGDTRWTATIKALKKFVQDPGSAGLGVALRFWGDNSPVSGCNETNCNATACKSPLVPLGVLKLATGAADAQETALVNAMNSKAPGGATPMYPALDGALQWAIANKAAKPNEETIVVFATDGEPNGCNGDPTAISDLAGAAFTNYGIKTYAIGIQDANPVLMNGIAQKGGTQKGFFVVPGANVENDLLSVMIQIKGDTLSCDFIVPGGNLYDPSAAVVTYTPSVGAPVTLTNVANLASCVNNTWYYDNPAAPTQLKLCPNICSTMLSDSGGKIAVDLGCPGDYTPISYTYPYQATCPQGSKVQWSFLTYDSLTPGDSKVVWEARTAPTLAQIGNAMYKTLATSKASPDTQVCAMGGPAPCPINLFNAFGLPDARNDHLELMITLYPATTKVSAAVVKSWDVTYSCPPSE